MSKTPEAGGVLLAKRLAALSDTERASLNEASVKSGLNGQRQFQAAFDVGTCYLCDDALNAFSPARPCLHWLLRPQGVKKRHIAEALKVTGAFRAQTYLRWVASTEAFGVNINDLPGDEEQPKLIELTIRYQNFEWSFSCGQSDFAGHLASKAAAFPHYHFQMRVNGHPFIGYNDFHLPLKRDEIAFLHAQRLDPRLKVKFPGGEGMADLLNENTLDQIVELPIAESDEANAPFHLSSMIMADEGTTISGDDLHAIIERARSEKKTIASLARSLPNVSVQTFIGPGPAVVDIAERSGRRKEKRE